VPYPVAGVGTVVQGTGAVPGVKTYPLGARHSAQSVSEAVVVVKSGEEKLVGVQVVATANAVPSSEEAATFAYSNTLIQ
jgi:hypothetical protein